MPSFSVSGAARGLARILATPAPNRRTAERMPRAALLCAAALCAWLLFYKLACFRGLAYTSDLFQFSQLATSWLRGQFLTDNCYGDHLSVHTYLFCPLLALVVVPFGPAGLLLILGAALAAMFLGVFKVVRLFDIPPTVALGWAAVMAIMPLSIQVYRDEIYGFHVELLVPVIGIWLTYFLLRRNWPGALGMALLLISIKEEEPLIAAVIALAVACEDLIRAAGAPPNGQNRWRAAFNLPALSVLVLAVAALPVLLHVLRSHVAAGYSPGSLGRIRTVDHSTIEGEGDLVAYLLDYGPVWLKSPQVVKWLGLVFAGTFGLIVLRPHFLLLGAGTTLISWFAQDDLFWAPRLAPPLAFVQVVATLGFVSAFACIRRPDRPTARLIHFAPRAVIALVLAGGIWWQFRQVPATVDVYAMRPPLTISRTDRLQADALFEKYRQLRRSGDSVIASPLLFRYADYRSLLWADRLAGRPTPIWALSDYGRQITPEEAHMEGYQLVGQAGRFALFHLTTP